MAGKKTVLTVLYPNTPGSRFDWDYYLNTHTPKAKAIFGGGFTIGRGMTGLGGGQPAYTCICRIEVPSLEAFNAAMAKHGAEIQADIANYTDVVPVIQLDESVEAA
jgi:uncharacterized protein (TIGR02118 family)